MGKQMRARALLHKRAIKKFALGSILSLAVGLTWLLSTPAFALPPVPGDDTATVIEDSVDNAIYVLSNDTDPESSPLEVISVTDPDHGTVVLAPDSKSVIYTPDPNYAGSDLFTYTVRDLADNTATGIVTVTVTGINDPPTDIALDSADVNENLPVGTVVGNFSSTDADTGDSHTYGLVAGAGDTDNASFIISGTALQTNGVFNFELQNAYSIRVQTRDGNGETFQEPFTITINDINEAPNAADDTIAATDEDTPLNVAAPGLLFNDSDVDIGDSIAVQSYDTTSARGASITIYADGSYVYDPTGSATLQALAPGDSTTDHFTYTITDLMGATDSAQVSLLVNGANDAPVANDATVAIDENSPNGTAVHSVVATDVDMPAQTLAYAIVGGSGATAFAIDGATGEITVAASGQLDHEAAASLTLEVEVTDNGAPSMSGTATVTIDLNDIKFTLTVQKAGSAADGACTVDAGAGNPSGLGGGSGLPVTYTYEDGDMVTLTAVDTFPGSGSIFRNWGGDAAGTAYSIDVTMTSDKSITATFNPTHTLTINRTGTGADRTGASVTAGAGGGDPRLAGGTAPGSYVYEQGSVVSLTATETWPNPGCKFDQWVVASGTPAGAFNQASISTEVEINEDLTINGEFIGAYAIQSAARDNGTIAPEGMVVKLYGETQSYNLAGNPGFMVADVIVDSLSQGPHETYEFAAIDNDHTIVGLYMLGEKPYDGPPAGDDQIYRTSVPPLVLLVMGRNHKLYYEAYNDASDINGDGELDVGYNPEIDYYGYFDSHKIYKYDETNGRFYPTPAGITLDKKVNKSANDSTPQDQLDEWSGDFLNYLTMSRMDCLRKVLYGGYRSTDSPTETVLMRSYIPQDGHSWGKEYESIEKDGYNIRDYAPLQPPPVALGKLRHLFANTTLGDSITGNPDLDKPLLRVLTNSYYRIWDWVSIGRPVAGERCVDGYDGPFCEHGAESGHHPGHPLNHEEYDAIVSTYGVDTNKFTDTAQFDDLSASNGDPPASGQIYSDSAANPYGEDEDYLTIFLADLYVETGGHYYFAVDGDDAVEVIIDGTTASGYYGAHRKRGEYFEANAGPAIYLTQGIHDVEFRHEEATGADNYYLYWKGPDTGNQWKIIPAATFSGTMEYANLSAPGLAINTHTTYKLKTDETPASVMTDYVVRVKVCDASMPEQNSKKYPSGMYKPIGLLQRYGESGSMLFGLLSGSYEKNTSGGVLRKPVGAVTDEINPNTGQLTSVNGIIRTIDKFRIDGFTYNGYRYSDSCGSITDRPIREGECWMWGNPIAEMMYEGLRYFGGQGAATSDFDYGSGTSTRDYGLGLPRASWDDPFVTNDICARAFMLVLTDINPTYDSDQLPGVDSPFRSGFTGALSSADSPAVAFNAEDLADEISTEEGGLGTHYIGQHDDDFDGSCSPKNLSGDGFGDIRGLCPEEPTKEGSYYSASAAYFGRTHDVSDAEGEQSVLTYVVGLASPLPRIEIPVGGSTVTLVPFAKSVGRSSSSVEAWTGYQPTNTIVDFYIESLRPTSGTFRINYEALEQGGTYDMDAVCIYDYQLVDDNGGAVTNPADGTKVRIILTSEHADAPYIQHMGYIISGTTADGVYLEVRDLDTDEYEDVDYPYDTPPGVGPGDTGSLWDDSQPLPLVATRIFTAGETPAATLLESPLWYAAKWGGFTDLDGDKKPNLQSEWDEDGNGVPDTFFYVVNPLKLDQQLNRSFADILARGVSHVAPVVSVDEANRTESGDSLFMAFFKPMEENYWQGNLKKYGVSLLTRSDCGREEPEWTLVDKNGDIAGECDGRFKGTSISYWSETADGGYVDRGGAGAILKDSMPGPDPVAVPLSGPYYDFRKIYTYKDNGMTRFIHNNISNNDLAVTSDVMRYRIINWIYGYTFDTETSGTFSPVAKRDWILGDIVHSQPKIIEYEDLSGAGVACRFIAVGANDGMLHFFTNDVAAIGGTPYVAGQEVFAFIPGDLLPKLQNIGHATSHPFFVDGAITLHQSELKHSSGYYFKTLVFGERRGGKSYWALDVTQPDPSTWTVKWHIQGGPAELGGTAGFEELGFSWSKPHFAELKTDDSATVKEVVIFSGGYDPLEDAFPESFEDLNENGIWDDLNGNGKYDAGDEVFAATSGGTEDYDYQNPGKDNMGRGIFVVDLSDGNILFKATYGGDSGDVTTGIDQKYAAMKYCFPADISMIPFSPYEIVMYAADIYGQIWKIEYAYFAERSRPYNDPNSTRWTVKRIFTANPGSSLATGDPDTFKAGTQTLVSADAGRKMFYSPDVSYFGNDWTTKPVLYFGTGDRAHPRYAMISNRIYLVTDDDTLADETDLLNVTCNELDEEADADGDGTANSGDDVIRGDLYEILESSSYDCRGLYRVLDEQGNCTDDVVDHTGEGVLSQPTVFFKNAYFTSYQPTFDDPCNPAGNAFIYALDYSDYTSVFNYDESNDLSGQVRTITDTYRYLTGSSIPSGVKVITRQGRAAGVLSAGGAVVGAGQGGSTSIPGPSGGIEPLLWWTN